MKLNIEELVRDAGIETKLWNMGAASLVYTEGCHGVARAELEKLVGLIVERCAQGATKNANVFPDDGQATAGVINSAIRNLMED